jgi:HlyD family secretion protein
MGSFMNGNNGNGNGAKRDRSSNGVAHAQLSSLAPKVEPQQDAATSLNITQPVRLPSNSHHAFDSPIILQQSSFWSQAILWGLMGVTTIAIIWACIAKIEEAVPAAGKLEPTGTVKVVQAPVGGVVKAIYVEDGQRVKKGARLLDLDPTAAKSQLTSLQKIRTSLLGENQFYATVMHGAPDATRLEASSVFLKLPPEVASLTKSRAALVAENQLYRAQLSGVAPGIHLSAEQSERLQSNATELSSRVAVAKLEAEQLTKQLNQTSIKLASTKETLRMNQGILNDIIPLADAGAISRIQLLKQQQEVQTLQAEVDSLTQEIVRIKLAISQAQSKVQNTLAQDRKDWLTQIADNNKRIAEIDSQLTKAIVENNKRLAEIDSSISTAQLSLRYSELTAPSSGTVFDLQAHTPGFVANASQSILKIVPDDALTAKVFVTNRDIGFVKVGMDVDVRIDSFPFSEFGDVKGKLIWIGSDALPPDQIHPYYRFPAKIRLERQSLSINGRRVPLQSGMSVNANIKVRSRTVMSIFTDLFTKSVESLKFVR